MIGAKNVSWLAAVLISVLVALPGYAHAAGSADEAAIRAQTTSWIKAYNGGDAKAIAALYAEDAILLPPGAPGAKGRAAIQTFIAKDIADSKQAGAVFNVDPKTDVGVSGDLGWESGTYTVTVKGVTVEAGKFLSVSRKKDGKWLYIRDTWNADAAAAPAAPPAAPAKK